jgi:hypothetical protein
MSHQKIKQLSGNAINSNAIHVICARVDKKRTVSTRVVMFMMLFNGFTVEGEFMAAAASYMLTTPLELEVA